MGRPTVETNFLNEAPKRLGQKTSFKYSQRANLVYFDQASRCSTLSRPGPILHWVGKLSKFHCQKETNAKSQRTNFMVITTLIKTVEDVLFCWSLRFWIVTNLVHWKTCVSWQTFIWLMNKVDLRSQRKGLSIAHMKISRDLAIVEIHDIQFSMKTSRLNLCQRCEQTISNPFQAWVCTPTERYWSH